MRCIIAKDQQNQAVTPKVRDICHQSLKSTLIQIIISLKYQILIPSYIVSTSISEALYGANEFIEEQNTIAENELREKVGLLKSLTIDIGDEVKGHNLLLQETDNTFDRFVHYILSLTYHQSCYAQINLLQLLLISVLADC